MQQCLDDQIAGFELLREPGVFQTEALGLPPKNYWHRSRELSEAIDQHERTSIRSGHGTGKTHDLAFEALRFLFTHIPSTVITTAPTGHQVKDLLWREIRTAHANAKVVLGGKLTAMGLDLQEETKLLWFATGFSTKPDTVTQEATAFQGYHNEHVLIIFDEAAAILPEIWRAAEHVGAPYKRWVAIGNPTSRTGDFAATFKDPSWHNMVRAVCDTPNFKAGRVVIPGLYGREYEERMRQKYGLDSDEYKVRVLGEISEKAAQGAYYGVVIRELRDAGMIGMPEIRHDPASLVYTVWDPGYTTSIWWFQRAPMGARFLWWYEDSGPGVEDYAAVIRKVGLERGYQYGGHFVPSDAENNAQRVTYGKTVLEIGREIGLNFIPLPRETKVSEGIERTRRFLRNCSFTKDCLAGVDRIEAYHERLNKRMSTEDNMVFTGSPEKDGTEHANDSMRYASMAIRRIPGHTTSDHTDDEMAQYRALYRGAYA